MRQRMRRSEAVPPAATVIVRANRLDPDGLAVDAQRNFDAYGFYGISVFAGAGDETWMTIAREKFAEAEWIVLFSAGELIEAGLELWDTGRSPHFDVVYTDLAGLLRRILGVPHRVFPNPFYRRSEG